MIDLAGSHVLSSGMQLMQWKVATTNETTHVQSSRTYSRRGAKHGVEDTARYNIGGTSNRALAACCLHVAFSWELCSPLVAQVSHVSPMALCSYSCFVHGQSTFS